MWCINPILVIDMCQSFNIAISKLNKSLISNWDKGLNNDLMTISWKYIIRFKIIFYIFDFIYL